MVTQGLSERRALTVVHISAAALRYVPRRDPDPGLRDRIVALAHRHRRYGAGMIYLKLRQEGRQVNHKRVDRLYAEGRQDRGRHHAGARGRGAALATAGHSSAHRPLMVPRQPGNIVGVIQSFADAATADIFVGVASKAARRMSPVLWPAIRRKLDLVHRARSVQDLRVPPGNRLERLKGHRNGEWSLRVNDQFRITFRFEDGHAYQVACEDYH